jgi:hypothetical protein
VCQFHAEEVAYQHSETAMLVTMSPKTAIITERKKTKALGHGEE